MKWLYLIIFLLIVTNCYAKPNETLSLSVDDADIRTVIQQIAKLADRNIVVAEEVRGDVSLHVKEVDWNTALESILEAKQLQAIDKGNITLIKPKEAENTEPQYEEQSPEVIVRTLTIPLRFNNAQQLVKQMQSDKKYYLSTQGSIIADLRSNSIIIRDEENALQATCELISALDVPVPQVMIEARVVNIQNKTSRELGVRWGINNLDGINDWQGEALINLPIASPYAAQASFSVLKLPQDLHIDLELAALESEHLIEEIANPRLITLNQQQAVIRQGDEIPYQETSANGATSVSFRDAVLELRVTPTITSKNTIFLALVVKNDSRSAESLAGDIPVISTKEISTQVILADGETVMLGGVHSQDKSDKKQGVPFLSKIPLLGMLFRNQQSSLMDKEMLIFVTPKIVASTQWEGNDSNPCSTLL